MSIIDPNSATGTIIISVAASVIGTAVLAAMAWMTGPLKWFFRNRELKRLLVPGRRFVFCFNPITGQSKIVTFEETGRIGEGRNDNEHTWRVRRGALDIHASDGKIYSRFNHDKKSGLLKHTNDPDTRSIHGQYLQPNFLPWKNAAQQAIAADAAKSRG